VEEAGVTDSPREVSIADRAGLDLPGLRDSDGDHFSDIGEAADA
jgi:hypothetical protein